MVFRLPAIKWISVCTLENLSAISSKVISSSPCEGAHDDRSGSFGSHYEDRDRRYRAEAGVGSRLNIQPIEKSYRQTRKKRLPQGNTIIHTRSEKRRVGKECR